MYILCYVIPRGRLYISNFLPQTITATSLAFLLQSIYHTSYDRRSSCARRALSSSAASLCHLARTGFAWIVPRDRPSVLACSRLLTRRPALPWHARCDLHEVRLYSMMVTRNQFFSAYEGGWHDHIPRRFGRPRPHIAEVALSILGSSFRAWKSSFTFVPNHLGKLHFL